MKFSYVPIALCFTLLNSAMVYAYRRGEINVQKMLFGSLMMMFVTDNITRLTNAITDVSVSMIVITSIKLLLTILIMISHLIQQMDRSGSSSAIVINRFCGFAIVADVAYIAIIAATKAIAASDVAFTVGTAFTQMMVICMETRIDECESPTN